MAKRDNSAARQMRSETRKTLGKERREARTELRTPRPRKPVLEDDDDSRKLKEFVQEKMGALELLRDTATYVLRHYKRAPHAFYVGASGVDRQMDELYNAIQDYLSVRGTEDR